jgi:hypothetical protein
LSAKDRRRLAGKRAAMPSRILAAPRNPWDVARDRTTRRLADKKQAIRGRKPLEGEKKQFLTSIGPDVIRLIKAAAALRDKTPSLALEEAAKEWLDRHQDGKR